MTGTHIKSKTLLKFATLSKKVMMIISTYGEVLHDDHDEGFHNLSP